MFWLGIAAVGSAILVFCGSVWLVLSMYIGRKLAYFIVASISLCALSILAFVWSFVPLGPVGTQPEWKPQAVGEQASSLPFKPAAQYPNGAWYTPPADDTEAQDQAGAITTPATDSLTAAIGSGKVKVFASASDAVADANSVKFLQQGKTLYGAIQFNPVKPSASGEAVVVMRWDTGDVFGQARLILLGVVLLLLVHLVSLWLIERSAARAVGRDIL
jgi:hypothetical protein